MGRCTNRTSILAITHLAFNVEGEKMGPWARTLEMFFMGGWYRTDELLR